MLEEAKKENESEGLKVHTYVFDVTNDKEVEKYIDIIEMKLAQ